MLTLMLLLVLLKMVVLGPRAAKQTRKGEWARVGAASAQRQWKRRVPHSAADSNTDLAVDWPLMCPRASDAAPRSAEMRAAECRVPAAQSHSRRRLHAQETRTTK